MVMENVHALLDHPGFQSGPLDNSIRITWLFKRNAESWAMPRPTESTLLKDHNKMHTI